MQNPASDNSVQMPPSPSSNENSSSSKFNLLLTSSILVFVVIVGATLYLILMNQKGNFSISNPAEEKLANSENQINIPVTPVVSMSPEQTLEKYGVVCRRFTSIEEALSEAQVACDLDLSGQNLSNLPNEISQLKNLTEINLSNNNFSEFPSVLFELDNLLTIDLSNNNISSLPEEVILRIPNIQFIMLDGNNLSNEIVSQYASIQKPTIIPNTSDGTCNEKVHGPSPRP